jgi:general secretion pathway protein M
MIGGLRRSITGPLSPRQERALAVFILALLVALVLAIPVLGYYFLHRHYSNALDQQVEQITRFQRVAAQQPGLRKAIDEVAAKDARRFYLKASVPNLAGAELQDLVRSAVEGNGGRISSIQVAPTRDEGRYRQVTVNVQVFANIIALQKILNAIETRQPYLFVDNLVLRSLQFRGAQVVRGVEPEINVQMDVSAYALLGAGS